jgi:indole-3-glycerol phosphate synthase
VTTYLDDILRHHRERSATDARSLDAELDGLAEVSAPRDFGGALQAPGLGVIAEIKRRSPSKGSLAPGLDPADLARRYVSGGAACLSVLTDGPHFGGSQTDLVAARAAVGVPILRKDFTVSPLDVVDARRMGADAVLLIVAALDDAELADLHALVAELGMTALVEIHDRAEAERAEAVGARVIGVNQRDLTTFEVRHDLAARMASDLPAKATLVAESGVRDGVDARRAAEAGFAAVLVGESLVTAADPGVALRALLAN